MNLRGSAQPPLRRPGHAGRLRMEALLATLAEAEGAKGLLLWGRLRLETLQKKRKPVPYLKFPAFFEKDAAAKGGKKDNEKNKEKNKEQRNAAALSWHAQVAQWNNNMKLK